MARRSRPSWSSWRSCSSMGRGACNRKGNQKRCAFYEVPGTHKRCRTRHACHGSKQNECTPQRGCVWTHVRTGIGRCSVQPVAARTRSHGRGASAAVPPPGRRPVLERPAPEAAAPAPGAARKRVRSAGDGPSAAPAEEPPANRPAVPARRGAVGASEAKILAIVHDASDSAQQVVSKFLRLARLGAADGTVLKQLAGLCGRDPGVFAALFGQFLPSVENYRVVMRILLEDAEGPANVREAAKELFERTSQLFLNMSGTGGPSPAVPAAAAAGNGFHSGGRGDDVHVIGRPDDADLQTILKAVAHAPRACRETIAVQHRASVQPMRAFLRELGRVRGDGNPLRIHLSSEDFPPHPRQKFKLGGLTGDDVAYVTDQTYTSIVHDGRKPFRPGPDNKTVFPPEDLEARQHDGDGWSARAYADAQRLAVVGPVFILGTTADDDRGGSVKRLPAPPVGDRRRLPVCVSVPSINLAMSVHDRAAYLGRDGRIVEGRITERMRLICFHAFHLWADNGVEVPVVPAIGCGTFRGTSPDADRVPELWADAAAWVLSANRFPFRCVVFTLPDVGAYDNFGPFRAAFHSHADRLRTPVVLTRRSDMLPTAALLDEALELRTGILNPSDAASLRPGRTRTDAGPACERSGRIGRFWDGSMPETRATDSVDSLQELLATQTTLLLHHRDVNPFAYTNGLQSLVMPPVGGP